MQTGGFITDDGPKLTIAGVAAKGHMDWAIPLAFMELNGVPTERLPPLQRNVLQLAPPVTSLPNPSVSLHPNPVVPAQLSRDGGHGIGVNKASVSEQDDLHPMGQSVGGLMEHLSILAVCDRGTAVLEHPPDHGQCSASVHNRQAYQAILIPKQ